ncbi:MAG: recombinase family protein [Chloroflexi bacterium]|nr:recombinase family protein [Chloroflexota bacterium]
MTKRAILYARVSTDEQADKGYSLPSQFDAMRKYAAQQGFEIVAEFQDDYSGATPIEHRPEGRKAYAMLQSGAADVIIAYTIDRFVRPPEDGDEWEMPILIRGLAKLGKEIHTCDIGKLKTDFVNLLLVVIGAKSAGEERRKIRERSMRGKRAKVKSGKVLGIRAPYGYRHVRDQNGKTITFEIDEATARVVRLIYRWYVKGDEHGKRLSDRAIALRLSEMGVIAPGALQRGIQRKRGKTFWNHAMIGNILTNEVYAGTWRYGIDTSEQTKRENWESVSVSVPAIIDRETWERVQAQRTRSKELAKRNVKRDYLLRGMIHCGLCGYYYAGNSIRKNILGEWIRYYRDEWYKVRHINTDGRCANKSIRADAIEADVWDEIRELFQDLDRLWNDLKAAQREEDDQLGHIHEKIEITDEFIRKAERDADKTASALKEAEKGGAVYKSLKRDEAEVNARLEELNKQREKLMTQLGERKITDESIEAIMEYARNVRAGIDNATFEDKRRTLETLDVQVTITQGKYHVACILGEKDGEISRMAYGGGRIVTNSS